MKLVILDRDGVINEQPATFVKHPDEWVPIAGSLDAIARLTGAGYCVAVATNQSGVARGLIDLWTLNAIHSRMLRAVQQAGGRIDVIYYCPHAADSLCPCRKPAPGMFIDIGQRFGVSLAHVPAIGDSLRDLQAAAAAGARPVLVRTGRGKETEKAPELPGKTRIYDDLSSAVDAILSEAP
ncbi:MAG: D-glycero-beta-D-manno-heptose 1,7-bisphosphate 7-phosphatase [Casimicrobiaceae bacterium]|nr:D-glycero-beta-D-manno-heptose 1,7-bisphosphate 7-phosphatase [Casimicrobiaceae bacterium]MCX8098507.1 D-glycero-beta-D-manno-heptose 1,7-bisphosphate 7-phosphatase [Casimicrobiaceae bacterium]MDW8311610.1 D-glycero-beta-D-manno-heptose 1,7-bisphosphate 7-phosphatase [Burkholderiales bacterium]